ncbi:hypothetical protein O181_089901 [Austropuccinia psidii MF-1]|uniref:Uncharacterized protein n=1 Tax=Austropuccinia psidii MF-1 TaxID=1389203 RepID=A0A9Q3IUI6_9BASI|nr:hypothetical protein [Austropuccinia psidii MF-1]
MSSKLTELTESSPSTPPPSVLCGSGIFSQLSSPSMASSGHFYPSQTYDGYKAVEVLGSACTECLARGKDCFQNYNPRSSKFHYCFIGKRPYCFTGVPTSNFRRYLWSRKDGPFGKEFPVPEAPTPDGTSGYSHLTGSRQRDVERWTNVGGPIPVSGRPIYSSSEVPISRINTEGVVKRIRSIADSPTDPDAEDSKAKLFPVLPELSNLSLLPFLLPFQLLHQVLYHSRPAFNQAVRPSPSQPPITTSQQLQPMASSSRRRDGLSPLPFPASQVFQRRDHSPI